VLHAQIKAALAASTSTRLRGTMRLVLIRDWKVMGMLLLEALVAITVLVVLVWWTMSTPGQASTRKKLAAPTTPSSTESRQPDQD
jgi:hypothetical protein